MRKIEETNVDTRDAPLVPVIISDCGQLTSEELGEDGIDDPNDPYEDYPDLWEGDKSPKSLVEIGTKLKELGNEAFKAGNYERALDKYQKVRLVSGRSADIREFVGLMNILRKKRTMIQSHSRNLIGYWYPCNSIPH